VVSLWKVGMSVACECAPAPADEKLPMLVQWVWLPALADANESMLSVCAWLPARPMAELARVR
jgi:hypothetical protein